MCLKGIPGLCVVYLGGEKIFYEVVVEAHFF